MKKLLFSALAMLLLVSASSANEMAKKQKKMRYTAVPASKATLVQEGDSKAYCPVCGMTLPIFYKTNHAAKSKDGMKQYCSIHCLVEDKILLIHHKKLIIFFLYFSLLVIKNQLLRKLL